MTDDEIVKLIESKIRQHEIRVAWISGIIGLAVTAGIFHAIHLNRVLLR